MKKETKLSLSKNTVLVAWIIAIICAITLNFIELPVSQPQNDFSIPVWCMVLAIIASTLMAIGILIGSRGIGVPLTGERLFSVMFGYPCWIPAVVYLFLIFVVPIHRYIF